MAHDTYKAVHSVLNVFVSFSRRGGGGGIRAPDKRVYYVYFNDIFFGKRKQNYVVNLHYNHLSETVLMGLKICFYGEIRNFIQRYPRYPFSLAGPRSAVDSASDSRARGPKVDTRSGHILSFLLSLIQERQLSVAGDST